MIEASFNEGSIIDGYTIKLKAGIAKWPASWEVMDSMIMIDEEQYALAFQVCPDKARKDPKVKSVLSFIKRTLKGALSEDEEVQG